MGEILPDAVSAEDVPPVEDYRTLHIVQTDWAGALCLWYRSGIDVNVSEDVQIGRLDHLL